jgi:D-alanyl-lipoteichoic acid acyltransferase DltB (MBOAT superfamily)
LRFKENVWKGVGVFLIGLFKKVVLADGMAQYSDPLFKAAQLGDTVTFFEAWAGVLAYTFQIYFDFSGYSDMAIGLALLFGVTLPINFNAPYQATNIIDFWRRWHMTLSQFLRDYLYIPLGGNRGGKARTYLNIMLTMLLGGLWHGAGWTFIFWGGLHGAYLIINRLWRAGMKRVFTTQPDNIVYVISARTLTFIAVAVAWVFFRAESFAAAKNILTGMTGANGLVLPYQFITFAPFLGNWFAAEAKMPLLGNSVLGAAEMLSYIGAVLVLCQWGRPTHKLTPSQIYAVMVATFYLTVQALVSTRTAAEFIYFQF